MTARAPVREKYPASAMVAHLAEPLPTGSTRLPRLWLRLQRRSDQNDISGMQCPHDGPSLLRLYVHQMCHQYRRPGYVPPAATACVTREPRQWTAVSLVSKSKSACVKSTNTTLLAVLLTARGFHCISE